MILPATDCGQYEHFLLVKLTYQEGVVQLLSDVQIIIEKKEMPWGKWSRSWISSIYIQPKVRIEFCQLVPEEKRVRWHDRLENLERQEEILIAGKFNQRLLINWKCSSEKIPFFIHRSNFSSQVESRLNGFGFWTYIKLIFNMNYQDFFLSLFQSECCVESKKWRH